MVPEANQRPSSPIPGVIERWGGPHWIREGSKVLMTEWPCVTAPGGQPWLRTTGMSTWTDATVCKATLMCAVSFHAVNLLVLTV